MIFLAILVLLCGVHFAGCVTVQSEISTISVLKGNNAQLKWKYTVATGDVFFSATISLASYDQQGKPKSTQVASFIPTGVLVNEPYRTRGWTASKSTSEVTLSITNVNENDDGPYSLHLTFEQGGGTATITFHVLVIPYFPRESTTSGKVTVDEGKQVTLKCEAEGSPKPITIQWRKDNYPLLPTKTSHDPNLVFKKVNGTNDGIYSCHASNTAGSATGPSVNLDVKFKPMNTVLNYTRGRALVDGESGSITCSAQADPEAGYAISGGNINFPKDADGIIVINPVRFTSLNNKDLTCIPSNRLGNGPTATLKLDVQVKPVVLLGFFKDRIMAIHGKNLSIKCRASGKPSADILWLRDGQPLRNSPRTAVVEFDSQRGVYISEAILLLAPARRQYDNGRYSCLAKNKYGDDTRSAELRLLYLPEITTIFRNREVRVNTRVELTCEAVGEPKVSHYVWRWPNGTLIQNRTIGSLVFPAIQRDEGGKLSCAAGSYLGEGQKKYIHLFVRVPPRIITPPLRRVYVNVSERLLLFCNASGVPEPVIIWGHNGKRLRVEGDVLDIASVRSSDRGEYNCTAWNGISPNATAFSTVVVFFAPEIVTNTPANTQIGAESGTRVQLACSVEANPVARLEWLYYPSRLPVNRSTDNDIRNIEITDSKTIQLTVIARIGAKYVCHAYNNRGNNSQVYEIRPKGPPESPTLLFVTSSIDTGDRELSTVQVYLKWLPGYDGGLRVSYRIFYRRAGESQQVTNDMSPACNCYTIRDELDANKNYDFFVQASNAHGPSNGSNVITIRTAAFYGEASVQRYDEGRIVKVDVLIRSEHNVTKVVVRYREVLTNNVNKRAVREALWIQRDMTYEVLSDREVIIDDLDPEKIYEFQVLFYVGNKVQIIRAGEVGTNPPTTGGRSGSSLSREEIIAIIAGVGGFLLIVILILFLCLVRRRQKPKRDEAVVVMRRQPGSVTADVVTRRSLIGSVEDDPFESAHYGTKEKKNGKARDSYYMPGPDDLNTFSSETPSRHSVNPAENSEAYQPYRFGKKPNYENQVDSSSSEDESLPSDTQKRSPSQEDIPFDPGYARLDDVIERNPHEVVDGPRGRLQQNPADLYSTVNKGNNNNRRATNERGAPPPPYRPRSTADTPRNLPPYEDEPFDDPLDLDDPSGVTYDDPLPPPMAVLPPSRSVPDNMWDHHYPDERPDDDSTLERERSQSRTSLPGRPYINVHGKLVRPGSSGRLSSSENVDDQKRMPEPEVPSGRSHQMDLDNDERNLVSYLV